MKKTLRVYVFAFFVSYLYSNIAILGIFLFIKLYFYFFKYKMRIPFFNFMYEDVRFLLFMPIITALAVMVMYFGRKRWFICKFNEHSWNLININTYGNSLRTEPIRVESPISRFVEPSLMLVGFGNAVLNACGSWECCR